MSDRAIASQLIDAANLSYAIGRTGDSLALVSPAADLLAGSRIDAARCRCAIAGGMDIDACLLGETDNGMLILAFRGTQPPTLALNGADAFRSVVRDWLNDANAVPAGSNGLEGRVHAGFLGSLDRLWPQIDAFGIAQAVGAGKKLYITGHSKGGSLAFLAAYRLAKAGIPIAGVYTFAAARPGDVTFRDAYDLAVPETWRFEFQDDIVPHLPPRTHAWIDIMQGLRAIQNFATNLGWGDAVDRDAKQAVDDLVDQIRAQVANQYIAPGQLQFINWSNPLAVEPYSTSLDRRRQLHLAEMLATLQLTRIAQDHFGTGGYSAWPHNAAPPG